MSNLNQIKEELEEIEKYQQQLEQKKVALQQRLQKEAELEMKLDEIVEQSGYDSARSLVLALVRKFNLRLSAINTPEEAPAKTRRSRTLITPELRDAIRQDAAEGKKKLAISRDRDVSYSVVNKVFKGDYDHL